MKILVYGAGPLGSLFAGRLHEAGHEVSLLARGQRLVDLREHGVVLVDTQTGVQTVAHVEIVERLNPDDAYDLVLVMMGFPMAAGYRRGHVVYYLVGARAGIFIVFWLMLKLFRSSPYERRP